MSHTLAAADTAMLAQQGSRDARTLLLAAMSQLFQNFPTFTPMFVRMYRNAEDPSLRDFRQKEWSRCPKNQTIHFMEQGLPTSLYTMRHYSVDGSLMLAWDDEREHLLLFSMGYQLTHPKEG